MKKIEEEIKQTEFRISEFRDMIKSAREQLCIEIEYLKQLQQTKSITEDKLIQYAKDQTALKRGAKKCKYLNY